MKTQKTHTPPAKGFALIATILLMVLLAIITVGTLSLSVVTLRTGNQDSAQARARANARMALMIAIGELQKQMGPDQRISANSAILDESTVQHSHWLGVWNSWKAGDGESSQHSTIQGVTDQMAPTYLPNRSDYFRKWLVSLNDTEASTISSPLNLALQASDLPNIEDDAIYLVSKGSLGKDSTDVSDLVAVRLLDIKDLSTSEITGRYGWWIGDESQKARLMDDSYLPTPSTPALTSAEKIYRSAAPASMGTKTISGLENMTDDTQLAALPSLATLDLVTGAVGRPAQQNFHDVTPFSYSILTDVREGGLKRDLSVILEQPIDRANSGSEYMLYQFDDARFPGDRSNSRVPIQDLSAYYQLYDNEPSLGNNRRGGVSYNSGLLSNAIQTQIPDYDGNTINRQRFLREYTTLYRQPVIAKVQFLLAVGAQIVTTAERQAILDNYNLPPGTRGKISGLRPMRDSDTHKLRLGVMPMVTLWNPTNVPLVMDTAQFLRFGTPPFSMRWRKYRDDGSEINLLYSNLNYAMGGTDLTTGASRGLNPFILNFRFANSVTRRTVFQPGEVKVFSIPTSQGGTLKNGGNFITFHNITIDPVNSWDPYGFFLAPNSTPQGANGSQAPDAYRFNLTSSGECMVFSPNDKLSLEIVTENPQAATAVNAARIRDGRNVSMNGEIYNAGFNLTMLDSAYEVWTRSIDFLRHYQMVSRHGTLVAARADMATFNANLLTPGFPGGIAPIQHVAKSNSIPGTQIIGASAANEVIGLLDFSLAYGCEAGTAASGGFGGGRRVASRPFLHSPLNAAPFIDQVDKASLYDYGWDWQIGSINNIEDSIIQAKPGTGNGYHGGGYTVEAGTTHVVQRDIPVLPPISLASLSHAQLGGYSLAYAAPMGDNPDTDAYWWKAGRMHNPVSNDYQKVTATGQGGLAPQVTQSIGNSYAHPNIPAELAFTTKTRLFDFDEGQKSVPFVDHSYLANKALWDEYFFSSMSPQPSKVELFGAATRTAKQVADDFFFGDGSKLLPNRRIEPYKQNLNQTDLNDLFTQTNLFTNGLGDKIASHLLVNGAFNVNSTSVDAWKILFSSLRGKPVAYLQSGKTPSELVTTDKTPVASSMLPTATLTSTSDITSPNQPPEQWKTGRLLTDQEIKELAVAMVKQVKLRGPFLSMSEFVNRRLTSPGPDGMALKGALQAALDDPSVTINANFRTPGRLLDSETAGIQFAFPDAAKGPVAYGSMAYVDQADVLRGFAEQLTPRGDTFVIRTYGDALDSKGNVIARAWCEAVVQRVPEYINSQDDPHLKQADSTLSDASKMFGRKIQIVSFRWLNSSEI